MQSIINNVPMYLFRYAYSFQYSDDGTHITSFQDQFPGNNVAKMCRFPSVDHLSYIDEKNVSINVMAMSNFIKKLILSHNSQKLIDLDALCNPHYC